MYTKETNALLTLMAQRRARTPKAGTMRSSDLATELQDMDMAIIAAAKLLNLTENEAWDLYDAGHWMIHPVNE